MPFPGFFTVIGTIRIGEIISPAIVAENGTVIGRPFDGSFKTAAAIVREEETIRTETEQKRKEMLDNAQTQSQNMVNEASQKAQQLMEQANYEANTLVDKASKAPQTGRL